MIQDYSDKEDSFEASTIQHSSHDTKDFRKQTGTSTLLDGINYINPPKPKSKFGDNSIY
jgi:hypothetical protein